MLKRNLTFALVILASMAFCCTATTVTVAAGGSIQTAINSLPKDNSLATIYVTTPGIYVELITISRSNIIFKPTAAHRPVHLRKSNIGPVLTIQSGVHNITFYNWEIMNIAGEAAGNQNAIKSYGGNIAFYNCKIVAYGDTAYFVSGNVYFYQGWIEGTVDFVYGSADVYVVNSTIASSGLGSTTAASTALTDVNGGLVFKSCSFIPVISTIYDVRNANDHSYPKPLSATQYANSVILGRPWHNGPRTIIVDSVLDSHISPAGWSAWNYNATALAADVFYAEYGNTGAGSSLTKRVSWSKKLTASQAKPYLSAKTFFTKLGYGTSWIDSAYLL